jgi:hypothetical protein
MRRFLRPILRRPFPVFLVPTRYSTKISKVLANVHRSKSWSGGKIAAVDQISRLRYNPRWVNRQFYRRSFRPVTHRTPSSSREELLIG